MVVTWAELPGPHMGHITKIVETNNAGGLSKSTSVEGEIRLDELVSVFDSIRSRDTVVEATSGATSESQGPVDVETWRKRWEVQEALLTTTREHLDAALGAARIMAEALGIDSSERSHVAKLLKQCHSKTEMHRQNFRDMENELFNLESAMRRFGFDPLVDKAQPLPKYCQHLAHNFDTMKREGWALGKRVEADSVSEGRAVVHLSREQKIAKLFSIQMAGSALMVAMATEDGFIKEGMDNVQVAEASMKWSRHIDNQRRVDAELAKMAEDDSATEAGPPDVAAVRDQKDAEKLAARTKRDDEKLIDEQLADDELSGLVGDAVDAN